MWRADQPDQPPLSPVHDDHDHADADADADAGDDVDYVQPLCGRGELQKEVLQQALDQGGPSDSSCAHYF